MCYSAGIVRGSISLLFLIAISSRLYGGTAADSSTGKPPDAGVASAGADLDEPLRPYVGDAEETPAGSTPLPFTSLPNAVAFIHRQRGLGARGLPATFYVPEGSWIPNSRRELIISEGVGLYDTALAIIALVEAGDLAPAREILDIYKEGAYSRKAQVPMELRAYPNRDNGGAFSTFDEKVHYFFDFTNVHGEWLRWRERWEFWTAHSGPNAWLTNALVRFIDASRRQGVSAEQLQPYVDLARMLGEAMRRLQDAKALGGVRYGPENQYFEEGTAAPFDQINSENNISAYVAFRMLYRLTGDPAYDDAAGKILEWFRNAPVFMPDGRAVRGLYDPETGTLEMGAEFKSGHWVLQPEHPTDSGGTWTISSLGPEKIDALWGPGAAYRMWKTIRARAGRTADFKAAHEQDVLAGLDYTDVFPENESLISPEWTAGGLFALKLLVVYYKGSTGRGVLTRDQIHGMERDRRSMAEFVRRQPNSYAIGPGHGGRRRGQTGFGWSAPPPEVQGMSSIYVALYLDGKSDPSAWWRKYSARPGASE
jgi:hypothetical protein